MLSDCLWHLKTLNEMLKELDPHKATWFEKRFLAVAAQEVINYEGVSPATWNRIHIAEKC